MKSATTTTKNYIYLYKKKLKIKKIHTTKNILAWVTQYFLKYMYYMYLPLIKVAME